MDYYTTVIHSKMSKIESSLLELNNEIITGVNFLQRLKKDAALIVRNLNSITTPATYLQEYVNVNSFMLKYMSFLSEINCRFEMLNLSESNVMNRFSNTKAITSAEVSEVLVNSDSNCKPKTDLLNEIAKEKDNVVTPVSESDAKIDGKIPPKAKKKKSKKAVKVECESENKNECNRKSLAATTTGNSICKTDCVSNVTHQEQKNSLKADDSKDTSEKKTLDSKCHSLSKQLSNTLEAKKSNSLNEKPPTSENVKQKSFADVLHSASVDVRKNDLADKIVYNKITLSRDTSLEAIPPTETQKSNFKLLTNSFSTKSPEGSPEASKLSDLKEEKDEEDCIKPGELPRCLGKEYEVTIEYIKSPSEFYVSVIGEQSSSLSELEKMLKLIPLNKTKFGSKKLGDEKALLSNQIGTYALFYSRCEEMWCRVKITNCVANQDNYVIVFLLDYGETKCVSIDDLCPMPEHLKKFPAFIHRCHLHGILPIDMNKNSDTIFWEKASSEKLKSLTENSKSFRIKIAPNDCFHKSTSLPVILFLVEDNLCVNQLLVESKYAKWSSETNIKDVVVEEEKEILKKWDPMKEDFESHLNSYDLDMNDPAAYIYGYVGKDHERICKHFAKSGFCFKGPACRREHKKLDPLGFTCDQEEIYKNAFNILPTPSPNSVLNVQITCFLKCNQFFCVSKNSGLSSCEENLWTLLNCMNKAESIWEMKKLLIPPSAGQIVIARFSEDDCWYRARILESQPEKDVYTVLFVDYGNKETLPLSEMRAIEPRYLHLPFQAMQCFIFGIDENPKVPVKDVMDYMKNKVNQGHISIEVITSLPGEDVNLLVNVFDQNGRNLGRDLIEKNYAISKEEMVISMESELVPG